MPEKTRNLASESESECWCERMQCRRVQCTVHGGSGESTAKAQCLPVQWWQQQQQQQHRHTHSANDGTVAQQQAQTLTQYNTQTQV